MYSGRDSLNETNSERNVTNNCVFVGKKPGEVREYCLPLEGTLVCQFV